MKNKKAQMTPQSHGHMFGNAHPVFVIGIGITVLPYIMNMPVIHNFTHITFSSWITGVGMVIFLVGAVLSIVNYN